MSAAKAIIEELRKYDESLFNKPRWLVLNKIDLIAEDERDQAIAGFLDAYRREIGEPGRSFAISALSGEGCTGLTSALMQYLSESAEEAETYTASPAGGATLPGN